MSFRIIRATLRSQNSYLNRHKIKQFGVRDSRCINARVPRYWSYRPNSPENGEKPAKSEQVPIHPDFSILHDQHSRYKVAAHARTRIVVSSELVLGLVGDPQH